MNTESVKLSQLKVNNANPRQIKDEKFRKLIDSLLVLPKMLNLRPVVVDATFTALGGNMRLRALNAIAQMKDEEIASRLSAQKTFVSKTDAEKQKLIDFWKKWKDKPMVQVVKASELSDAEQREFIIKDNASFGEWDYDTLANEWDYTELNEWGLDVWNPEKTSFGGGYSVSVEPTAVPISIPVDGENNGVPTNQLPEELQHLDINPDELPKLQGDDVVPMERIIIVFPKERAEELATHLGLESLSKVIYNIEELTL